MISQQLLDHIGPSLVAAAIIPQNDNKINKKNYDDNNIKI